MKLLISLAVAASVFAAPALADFKFKTTNGVAALNEAAASLGVQRLTFSSAGCDSDVREVCRFRTSAVAGMVAGDPGGAATEVIAIYNAESDPLEAMLVYGVIMAALSPQLSKEERGTLLMGLLTPVLQEGASKNTRRAADVTYTYTNSDMAGLWFIATAK